MATNNVVARFVDGRTIKGISLDVDPNKPKCHIKTTDQGMVEVKLNDLKALFFVKDLTGDSGHQEANAVDAQDSRLKGAKAIEVRFRDKERLIGLTNRYPPLGNFFFMLPADGASNNIRILVNRAAVLAMGVAKPESP